MAKVVVTVDGVEYPCRQTMGAMLRFKRETGREISEIRPDSVSEMCVYFWCCVVSSCRHDGIPFDMSVEDFADALTPADIETWNALLTEESAAQAKAAGAGGKGKN